MASHSVHLPFITILHHSIIFLILIKMPSCLSSNDAYRNCGNLISCGKITNISFPFWGKNRPKECGHPLMQLICQNEMSYITIKDVQYQVLEANPDSHTLKITREDYLQDLCQPKPVSTTLDTQLYVYDSPYQNLTLSYGCTPSPPTYIRCNNEASEEKVYPQIGSLPPMSCKTSVIVPVPLSLVDINTFSKVHQAITEGFVVRWIVGVEDCDICERSGGVCGIEWSSQETTCDCRDGPCPNLSPDIKASSDDAHYTNCINPFKCGNTNLDLRYPFSGENRNGYCGEEKLTCEGDPKITINQIKYRILGWHNTTQTLTMARDDYWDSICVREYKNNTFDNTHFQYDHQYNDFVNVTLFYCPSNSPPSILTEPFGMDTCDALSVYYTLQPGLSYTGTCTVVVIPIFQTYDSLVSENKTTDALRKGFELKWVGNYGNCETCSDSGGECGVDDGDGNGKFQCFCDDGPHSASCTGKRDKKRKLIILGVTGSAIIAGVLISISILCVRYKSPTWQANFGLVSKSNQNIEAFLKIHGSLALKRYKLSHVKKMTNNFKVKLGQGGFGAVYKGKLSNGSLVAVKMLNALKKNGEEFMNEVASISRTSHVNVVTLLGFCLEGRKRALIYEFMPNGSLDKFIYRKRSETRPPLSWDIIYEIARDIARGLEYLHKGCNTRIFHFDIKPHNILLDENFYAKISDFGLAKLCPRNESIVSLSDARGTMGYVAPEMWNRNLGRVSHKSDVYSYGMMLLEMVGGRKNINVEASHTSEIYFPHWAYNKLELDNDLRPDMVMTIEENQIAKRLAIVGLWCTQTFPNDRPTMSKVIDMLEGNMDSLQIPPKPLLSSPTRSVPKYSISLN